MFRNCNLIQSPFENDEQCSLFDSDVFCLSSSCRGDTPHPIPHPTPPNFQERVTWPAVALLTMKTYDQLTL